ncbi:glycosyltransferase family 4 protein [Myxosarcina sp. GI1]|uniref:glycosyltransferase family 4 protein n=1 Tax=Myxosarcina sp. GI1 TaxID=1541065 RepID=UPI00056CD5D1|nr:glycosyltransferase family 4 protein [Myxosarcina sp. GI1]
MKILFIVARADTVAGAQIHVRDMAIALQNRQHKVLVITGKKGIYNAVLKRAEIESITCDSLQQPISPWQDWLSLRFLLNSIRKFQPELISTHSSKTGILGRLAAKITKTPCIFTAHGWSFTSGVPEPSRTIYQTIEQLAAPLADKIICVSECDRQIGIQSGMNPERLVTIHNGMKDLDRTFIARHNTTSTIKIVMVARFSKQKDHLTLIEAFKDIPQAELLLVGDGEKLAEVKAYIHQIGISEKAKILGFCENVEEILAQAHIFALISNWEGLPRTIIEAMRGGLPVVASDVGGVAELVVDGVTGYLIPRQDTNTLHQRLANLVSDAALRETMGKQGRQRYELNFTFEQMYYKTLQVYDEVMSERG